MNVQNINNINHYYSSVLKKADKQKPNSVLSTVEMPNTKVSAQNYQAHFSPVSFSGNAPKIEKAYLITRLEQDIPLMKTQANGSYLVDFDSQTEVIYGKEAIRYLKRNEKFPYDTQIIVPKKAEAVIKKDGKTIPLGENSAVMLNSGTTANIRIKKGYPMVIISKKDYDWYERYGKDSSQPNIKDKFTELMYHNSHLYNGDFSPNMFLPERLQDNAFLATIGLNKYESKNNLIVDLAKKRDIMQDEDRDALNGVIALLRKLDSKGIIQEKSDGYIKFQDFYTHDYQMNLLQEQDFTDAEINQIMPLFDLTRKAHENSRFCRTTTADGYPQAIIDKLKDANIVHRNKKRLDTLFWKKSYSGEADLRKALAKNGFTEEEQKIVVENWEKGTTSGFDITGLKFIDKDCAVYNLDEKLNNWTLEKTNWVTNSTALSNDKGTTPFIGASLVQTDQNKVFSMSDLRKGEQLHRHPSVNNRRQTELYMVTSGAAALIVVRDGKAQVKVLKAGDLAVIDPGVEHCVNSVMGEYEHIVVQVPSAFQYGFDFKQITPPPENYDEQVLTNNAKSFLKALLELEKE